MKLHCGNCGKSVTIETLKAYKCPHCDEGDKDEPFDPTKRMALTYKHIRDAEVISLQEISYKIDMLIKAQNRCPKCWHYGFGLIVEDKCERCDRNIEVYSEEKSKAFFDAIDNEDGDT